MESFKNKTPEERIENNEITKGEILNILAWSNEYEKKDGPVFVSPMISGTRLLNILGYKKQGEIYQEFIGKNITDIGSGLGGFVFEVKNSVNKINAVDPLYSSNKKMEIINIEEKRAKNRINHIQGVIEKGKKQIDLINNKVANLESLVSRMPGNQKLRYDVEILIEKKRELNVALKRTLKHLNFFNDVYYDIKKWEKNGYKNDDKLVLIGRGGEDTGLPDNSQDFVFITNTINKKTSDLKKILIEADRILKINGEIIISNNDKKLPENITKNLKNVSYVNDVEIVKLKKGDVNKLFLSKKEL